MQYLDRLRTEMKSLNFPDEYITLCCRYAENLIAKHLPVIFDAQHLQQILHLDHVKLDAYTTFNIYGKNKVRAITAPSRSLKVRQRWILEHILEQNSVSEYAHGFVKGRSILTNAHNHVSQLYMLNMDIRNFFPSISLQRIKQLFETMGYTVEVAKQLSQLCCYENALPQGAVTSPYLSNLICGPLDEKISQYAHSIGCKYSRYADDITLSGSEPPNFAVEEITKILAQYGFEVNTEKTRFFDERQVKHVTGLVVSDQVHIPKRFKRTLKQEIYYCKKFGAFRHLENTKTCKSVNFQEHLYGKIYFVKMIEPEFGQLLLEQAKDIVWT